VQILTKLKGQASVVCDRETIDSELRLIAALRRTAAEMGAPMPRIEVADELLDEWIIACRPTT
jgi:hypothetical protein